MVAAMLCMLLATPMRATVAPEHASSLVESTIIKIDWLINADIPRERLFMELEHVFRSRAAPAIICRTALGSVWVDAADGKKDAFLRVFIRYLSEKYSRYFNRFIGSEFEIVYARTTRNSKHFEVKTTIYKRNQAPYPVYWYLTVINNEPRIYNIIVDDLNLLALERSVMRNLLEQNGNSLDRLMKVLPYRYVN